MSPSFPSHTVLFLRDNPDHQYLDISFHRYFMPILHSSILSEIFYTNTSKHIYIFLSPFPPSQKWKYSVHTALHVLFKGCVVFYCMYASTFNQSSVDDIWVPSNHFYYSQCCNTILEHT